LRGAELAIHARSLTTETVFAKAAALAHDCHPTVPRWDLLQDNRVSGVIVPSEFVFSMSRFVKRSASQAVKSDPSGRWATLPAFVPAQLSQLVASLPRGLNGCTRLNWMATVWPRGSTMAACNS
jgi:hypothetical protein